MCIMVPYVPGVLYNDLSSDTDFRFNFHPLLDSMPAPAALAVPRQTACRYSDDHATNLPSLRIYPVLS